MADRKIRLLSVRAGLHVPEPASDRIRTDLVRKCQSMFVYFPWVAGRKDLSSEIAIQATGICNDRSLCTMEMTNILTG